MPPANTYPTASAPQQPKSTPWIVVAVIAIVLSLGLGGALWYVLTQKQPTQQTATDLPAQASTEQITAAFRIASPDHQVGTLITPNQFVLTVPKAWRTVNTSRDVAYANDKLVDSLNEFPLQLRMVPEDIQNVATGEVYASNVLELRDVTDWLAKSDSESTAAERQKAFDYIANQATAAEPKQMTTDNKGMVDVQGSMISGPFMRAKGVTSVDGSLKGVVYLTIGVQALSYDPAAIVVMTGTVNGKKVLLKGRFDIHDAHYKAVSDGKDDAAMAKVQATFKSGDIPQDAADMYQRVADAVATIEIKK